MKRPFKVPMVVYLFVVIVILAGFQAWAIYCNTRQVTRIAGELNTVQDSRLDHEKSRQEILGLRIKNESQAFFVNSLFTSVGPLVTTVVALIGALLGLRNYLDTREKERVERAANDLKDILARTADDNHRLRIAGIVSLQHFFMPDKREYHLQALSALVAIARTEKNEEVLRNIKIAAEKAMANLDWDILKQVSWQGEGVVLRRANFAGQTMNGLDFTDANLEDADFSGAYLEGARFVNARLNGANLYRAHLAGADLTYADLAGADLTKADLTNARLDQAKVLRMTIREADLRGAVFDVEKMPWALINGWRDAKFDKGIKEGLIDVHGPAPSGVRILMLLWEIPPLVAGGTWTASYHLVRNLQKLGVRLTVVVPWEDSEILPHPFGCDVDVVALGVPLEKVASVYGTRVDPPWSPYGRSVYSPYGASVSSAQWPGNPYVSSPYGFDPYLSSYTKQPVKGAPILRLMEDFKRRFLKFCRNEEFDIIHAHDWVTFPAAEEAGLLYGKPWVAHFHSTEFDRRATDHDPILARLEKQGADLAGRVVVPSGFTASMVAERYGTPKDKITVMPNPLSAEDISPHNMGDFESCQVTFTGRLTEQKRPDLFRKIAESLAGYLPDPRFFVYGAGELQSLFAWVFRFTVKGALPWERRGEAYRGSSAVLVTSRAEPFGMVILEAMQHHVPVFYPQSSGAAEFFQSGVKINPEDIEATAKVISGVLGNWELWESIVESQAAEIAAYTSANHERILIDVWNHLQKPVKI